MEQQESFKRTMLVNVVIRKTTGLRLAKYAWSATARSFERSARVAKEIKNKTNSRCKKECVISRCLSLYGLFFSTSVFTVFIAEILYHLFYAWRILIHDTASVCKGKLSLTLNHGVISFFTILLLTFNHCNSVGCEIAVNIWSYRVNDWKPFKRVWNLLYFDEVFFWTKKPSTSQWQGIDTSLEKLSICELEILHEMNWTLLECNEKGFSFNSSKEAGVQSPDTGGKVCKVSGYSFLRSCEQKYIPLAYQGRREGDCEERLIEEVLMMS